MAEPGYGLLQGSAGSLIQLIDLRNIKGLLQDAAATGWDPGELGLARRLAAVDAHVLANRLIPCVGKEAVTVVGHAEKIRASLESAGIPSE